MEKLIYFIDKKDERQNSINFGAKEENGVIHINMTASEVNLKDLKIILRYPVKGIYSRWSPECDKSGGITRNWYKPSYYSLASWCPVNTYIGKNNENILTVAFSDVVNNTAFEYGVIEETAYIDFIIKLFPNEDRMVKDYSETIYVITENIPYYVAINKITKLWEKTYAPMEVPPAAKLPMYSTWYSFHQHLYTDSLVEECKSAKKLGCDAVIVDDGWQTSDNSRGYAYCGDWEAYNGKFQSMKDFVQQIHDIDMKVLLWYSVPFVGKHSKTYKQFEGMYLDNDGEWSVFDPRFPQVRSHIIDTYKKALKEWNLDGFKLDFIDCFARDAFITREYPYDSRRDYENIPQAVLRLMTDIMKELKEIKSDIMIEFRQKYIGTVMRTFGNILRSTDCPADALTNKIHTVDLRLTSGKTAVHSDMIMFDKNETPEHAALQFIDTLFSVPQVSVKDDEFTDDMRKMIAFYLDFWRKNSDVLLDGEFIPLFPEAGFPYVAAKKDRKYVGVVYQPLYTTLDKDLDNVSIINGTGKTGIVLDANGEHDYIIKDCFGNIVESGKAKAEITMYNVPPAGIFVLERV